jgi:cytochrome subunit of sulfide dehydrogenase
MNPKASSLFFCAFGILILASVATATEASSFNISTNAQHTRTLAASCAACHGTNGNSRDTTSTLAGLDASYFTTQMLAFKNGTRSATVMHHHAKGLTADEINELAVYFSQQDRVTPQALKPQTLRVRHE